MTTNKMGRKKKISLHDQLINEGIADNNRLDTKYEEYLKIAKRIKPPTKERELHPGDLVQIGNLDYSKVIETYEEGKICKILTINEIIAYGRSTGKCEYRIWYQLYINCHKIVTKEENSLKPIFTDKDTHRFNFLQQDIEGLLHRYYDSHSGLDLNPDYQRDIVWTHEDKIKLIDSIFNNIEIGKFVIIRHPFESIREMYYELLDGKQRITALIEFYEDRYTYRGKFYSELSWDDKGHFKRFPITIAEANPMTNKEKYLYFLKLNTTGKGVSENHLNKVRELLKGEN